MIVWVTVALLAVCGFWGWRGGVIRRVLELAGVVLAVLASARLASAVAPWLDERSAMDATTALLASYFLVFIVALVATRLLASAISKLVHWTPLGWLDRLGGAVCGIALGALLLSVGLIAVSNAPRGDQVRETFTDDPVGDVIYHAAPSLYQGARQLFGGRVDELWHRAVEMGGEVVDEAERRVEESQ
jgi:uncharacterized membrane protein required for colicin V production